MNLGPIELCFFSNLRVDYEIERAYFALEQSETSRTFTVFLCILRWTYRFSLFSPSLVGETLQKSESFSFSRF